MAPWFHLDQLLKYKKDKDRYKKDTNPDKYILSVSYNGSLAHPSMTL